MNGAVFQESVRMIANLAGHSLPVQMMSVPSRWLTMPRGSKLQRASTATTAVGMAHGTSTLARTMPRPLNARCMMSAIASPSAVSMTTVTPVKKYVTAADGPELLGIPPQRACA